jgi:transposase
MGMADHSLDLKRRLVEAYRSGKSGTYAATAALFGVGEASVSRLLRRYRETGDVQQKPRGGNNPRRIDLAWLRQQLEAKPDDRLIDRIEAWEKESGVRVAIGTMWFAVRDCGWTHKKRPTSPASSIGPTSARSAKRSSSSNRTSTRRS